MTDVGASRWILTDLTSVETALPATSLPTDETASTTGAMSAKQEELVGDAALFLTVPSGRSGRSHVSREGRLPQL